MMRRGTIRRGGLALCLMGVLMIGLGCSPTSSSAPNINEPAKQKPEKKQSEQPKPDPG